MLDKFIEIKKYHFNTSNKSIKIKLLGDLHFCESFNDKKLKKIEQKLDKTYFEYLFITGNLLDSTNFLYKNNAKSNKLLHWLTDLGKRYKVFISLGNHDISYQTKQGWQEDKQNNFWKKASSLKGVHISHYEPYYEDEKLIIYLLEPNHKYYYNNSKIENKEILLSKLKKDKKYITNLNKNKIKIIITHSPILIDDPDILNLIKEYDFIFCGHMHNGLVPIGIDKLIKNNKGIIAPNKTLFPNNSRGLKKLQINNKEINLIVTGGVTKIQECAGILKYFNCFYPMNIDEISIDNNT